MSMKNFSPLCTHRSSAAAAVQEPAGVAGPATARPALVLIWTLLARAFTSLCLFCCRMYRGPLTLLAVLAVAVFADATALGLDTLEEDKRAPMGFNGMRGKKDDLLDDGFDKRAGNMLGFSGMRGKKSDEDADDALAMDKRARNQLGFSGMRGKKDDYDADDAAFMDKRNRNQLGFSGMRGKKDDYDMEADGAPMFDKRNRNTLGFSGMRGKKASSDEYVMDDLMDKRSKNTLGFSGMRGKKDSMDDVEAYLAKRARQAAFVGMRGRRENGQVGLDIEISSSMPPDRHVSRHVL